MNTTKSNIEYQIKKQIEEREITPSRDLWSEIEVQSAVKDSKAKINWFLVAVCLVLTFSLGAVLFFNKENRQSEKPEIVAEIKNPVIQNNTEQPILKTPEVISENPKESLVSKNVIIEKKNEPSKLQVVEQKEQLALIKENISEIASNISEIQPEKIIARSDSAKIPEKKKRYVDPSTLLFSVEHKDAIQKSKSTSNVASIEIIRN